MTKAHGRRPPELRRSWLFLPGAERAKLLEAETSAADVLIQELEDFVPAGRKEEARRISGEVIGRWKHARRLAAVRVNPLASGGLADLEAIMGHGPDIVLLPKTESPADIIQLGGEIDRLERVHRLAPGSTEIVPNIESARALMQTFAIARASPRVSACLVASEDMAADLGAERSPGGGELDYVRRRFLVECRAAKTLAIDCPYTFGDHAGVEADTRFARKLGYVAKSAVLAEHCFIIGRVLTPTREERMEARDVIDAFETARARGENNAKLGERLIEMPTYLNAKRLLERAKALGIAS